MVSSARGNSALAASPKAARTCWAMSLTRLAGKFEVKVLMSTLPSRSTVKLPEGRRSNVGADLEKKLRSPIVLKASSSWPGPDPGPENVSSRHKTQFHPGRLARRDAAAQSPQSVGGGPLPGGRPANGIVPGCDEPTRP